MNMNNAFRVSSAQDLNRFIALVDGLHDALLHEAVLLHPGYVNDRREMFEDSGLPNARLIFQSQLAEIGGFELSLKGIATLRLDFRHDFHLEGEYSEREVVLYPLGRRNSNLAEIRAAEMECRILGEEALGDAYRLTQR